MKIVLSGGTGFVGRALLPRLLEKGHQVVLLSRNPVRAGVPGGDRVQAVSWDAKFQGPWEESVNGAGAVINLAGEPIAEKRWTHEQKIAIVSSRVESTKALVTAIAKASKKPSVLINASAVGYYGDAGDRDLSESSPKGIGFLSDTCDRWENEAKNVQAWGVRCVMLRIGVVLERDGGALARMMPPFRLFAGGPVGSGNQYFPWVHREDVVKIILFALENPALTGPVNAAAPDPVTMREFCSALGRAMGRPSWAPVPAFVLRMLLGEMAGMLLGGQKVLPRKLDDAGYHFTYPSLDDALKAVLTQK